MSRTDEKGAGASHWEAADERADEGREPAGEPGESGGYAVADEMERTRLITDITRLIRESTVPEGARLAGLTLIGWLARRRTDEVPHAIGIQEARESERRIKATRPKMR